MINFSTKNDIIRTINSIDPYYAKTYEKDLYLLWYYGRDLIPGNPNYEYLKGTGQLYLLKSFIRNPDMRNLIDWFPGFRDLYFDTIKRIESEFKRK